MLGPLSILRQALYPVKRNLYYSYRLTVFVLSCSITGIPYYGDPVSYSHLSEFKQLSRTCTLARHVLRIRIRLGSRYMEAARQMSYKNMEAVLIEKVHQLREMEDELMRSYIQLQGNPCNATTAAVNLGFDLVDRQVRLIEGLMAKMDHATPVAASMLGSNNVVSPAYLV